MASQPDYDVLIVGGGMVGASLALALARTRCRIGLVEAIPSEASHQPSYDDRGLALSLASQRVLSGLGLWQDLVTFSHPIKRVHVSDQGHFGCVRLDADSLGLDALGHVVQARRLGEVLHDRLASEKAVSFLCPATVSSVTISSQAANLSIKTNADCFNLTTRLLVAADGSRSSVRSSLGIKVDHEDYGQTAIVSSISSARSHADTAFERFTPSGPLALLPLNSDRCIVVYTVKRDQAEDFMNMADDTFLACLQSSFGRRLGDLRQPGARHSYPLHSIIAREQIRERLVVLGNAAHTLHPNAAQGFNLCLRDIAGLTEVLIPALQNGGDPGEVSVLEHYRAMRESDQFTTHRFTDGMAHLFYNELPHKVLIRNSAMWFLELTRPLKHRFAYRAMGLRGHQPRLVRGGEL